ncbi:MAG: type II secretion system F family protein [Thermodesulfobacteriota bacterium]|nr:type II secretion system F family protein [Thermodesulfobacteriota bacterium]
MEITPLILSVSTFIAITLLYLALMMFLSARKKERSLVKRTERWSEKVHVSDPSVVKKQAAKKKGLFANFNFTGKNKKEADLSIYSDTPIFYQRAGIYNPHSIRFYQTLRVILFLAPIILVAVSHLVYRRPLSTNLYLGTFVLSCAGYFFPLLLLRIRTNSRHKELTRCFPDAMDLLMICVQAGMGIDSAIRKVSQEIYITSPELAKEFKILSLELKTGQARNVCLKNLAHRTNLSEVDNLVSLLIHAEKYGTGVANALKVHAEEMRQKRYSRLETQAAKLPVKLTVPMTLFIFPSFFVVIAGPAAIQVIRVIIQG